MPKGIFQRKPHTKEARKKISENHVDMRGNKSLLYKDGRSGKIPNCIVCGERVNEYRSKCCSRECNSIYVKQNNIFKLENNPNWLGGITIHEYPPTFNQQLKDRIRVRDNFICQLCGIPEIECNRRLDIHHIDYNKMNCNEDNLISLCSNCNLKANFNREYWTVYFNNKLLRQKGKENNVG